MRTAGYIIFALALCAALAGCVVVSLNPYYTEDAIVEFPAAAGEWVLASIGTDTEDKAIGSVWRFHDIYLEITDTEEEGGRSSLLESTFFGVANTVFMDTTARPIDEQKKPGISNWWAMHTLPVHLLTRVEAEGDTLTITPIDQEWLLEQVKAGETDLDYVVVDGLEVFTATSEEWMAFLEKYRDAKELYLDVGAYVLKRREAPEEKKPAEEPPEEKMMPEEEMMNEPPANEEPGG